MHKDTGTCDHSALSTVKTRMLISLACVCSPEHERSRPQDAGELSFFPRRALVSGSAPGVAGDERGRSYFHEGACNKRMDMNVMPGAMGGPFLGWTRAPPCVQGHGLQVQMIAVAVLSRT